MSTIKQFIRQSKTDRNKKGVMVAKKVNDSTVKIGWSLCCKRDNFDHEKGLKIAETRIDSGKCKMIPSSIMPQLTEFKNRAAKYFKNTKVVFVNPEVYTTISEKDSILNMES